MRTCIDILDALTNRVWVTASLVRRGHITCQVLFPPQNMVLFVIHVCERGD